MLVAAALLPIVVVLGLMVGLGWTAARAGMVGLAVTLGLAVGVFGIGADVVPEEGTGSAVGGALLEAGFTAVTILWIVVPALAIHNLQLRTGGTEVLRRGLAQLSADPRVVALLIAWFFALFMEGAAGFGASVALAAPFLVSAGFNRVEAVTAAMIGHAVGVSFGAVGTPVLPQISATGLTAVELSRAAGTYHLLLGWIPLLIVVIMVSQMTAGSDSLTAELPRRTVWLLTAAAAALFLLPMAGLAVWVGPELPTLGGALVGGGAFVALLVLGRRQGWMPAPAASGTTNSAGERVGEDGARGHHDVASGGHDGARGGHAATDPGHPTDGDRAATHADATPRAGHRTIDELEAPVTGRELLLGGAPYLVLVTVVLVTRLIPPVQDALRSVRWEWQLGETFTGGIDPLYHPGTALAIGFLAGVTAHRMSGRQIGRLISFTVLRMGPVAVALVGMLGLSRLMVHAGMTDVLAVAAAGAAGAGWPLFAPLVGMLGTFVTGSATASNILFTDFQTGTADTLDLPLAPMAGAQNFGSAVGNIICPHNIVAAGATVDLTGAEGEILRKTIGPALLYAALGGVVALVITS